VSLDPVRLRAIEQSLLRLLAVVREAILAAEEDQPRGQVAPARYVIQWRWVPAGRPRTGVLHDADTCWMAAGDRLDIGQVSRARERGALISPCDVCRPDCTK
jgi:hypothetical protein